MPPPSINNSPSLNETVPKLTVLPKKGDVTHCTKANIPNIHPEINGDTPRDSA